MQKSENNDVFDSERMPLTPDTPIARDCASCVTFLDPLTSRKLVSPTPCASPPPVVFNIPTISKTRVSGIETVN